jgi:hypothetical protein
MTHIFPSHDPEHKSEVLPLEMTAGDSIQLVLLGLLFNPEDGGDVSQ